MKMIVPAWFILLLMAVIIIFGVIAIHEIGVNKSNQIIYEAEKQMWNEDREWNAMYKQAMKNRLDSCLNEKEGTK